MTNATLIISAFGCVEAYKLYVEGSRNLYKFEKFAGYDFCFDDPLPLNEGIRHVREGDIINIQILIDLDFSKYDLDSPKEIIYLVTFLIELDPL